MRISDGSSDVCSSDLKAAFERIRSYSPYDQVKAQNYPPILITGGLNDPRVTYWEPAKWAAKLRATKTDQNVLLLKTNMSAGHGGKSGRFDSLEEDAEEMAFILWRSEEHTSELQSLIRISYAVFCLQNKTNSNKNMTNNVT